MRDDGKKVAKKKIKRAEVFSLSENPSLLRVMIVSDPLVNEKSVINKYGSEKK